MTSDYIKLILLGLITLFAANHSVATVSTASFFCWTRSALLFLSATSSSDCQLLYLKGAVGKK